MSEQEAPYDLRDILDNLAADLGQNRLEAATLKAELKQVKEALAEERKRSVALMEKIADLTPLEPVPPTVIEHSDGDLGVVVDGQAAVTDGDDTT